MRFDVIVGNPPYQNSNSTSDAGKLYLDITRKSLELLTSDGIITFLTPSTLAQEKKTGLTLKGLQGLQIVDYTANNYFNVGVEIMSWTLNKLYRGAITIVNEDGSKNTRKINESLVQEKDLIGFTLFEKIKMNKNKLFDGDQTTNGQRQAIKSDEYKYKVNVNILKQKVEYSRIKPRLYGKRKIAIHMGMAYNDKNFLISSEDFGQYQNCIDITNNSSKEIDNIKSFLFHPLTIQICAKYRKIYKTGMNNILYSFPPVDVTKLYTLSDVQQIFNLSIIEVDWLLQS